MLIIGKTCFIYIAYSFLIVDILGSDKNIIDVLTAESSGHSSSYCNQRETEIELSL